jgi:hypothetical protein
VLWEDTWLWQALAALRGRSDATVAAAVQLVMPDIERIVGERVVKDFTLHDAGHAARVAELMVEVMSEEVAEQLSAYELALLLLAAYLHDVGMAPRHALVASHQTLLVSGDPGALSDEDVQAFQRWLDREHDGLRPPIADPALAETLISHYVRDRHVDWGERWIMEELAQRLSIPGYDGFLEDLLRLCRSHHQGYATLSGADFAPRFLRRGKSVVHRRYLACVLRVADVLDIDPERTPEILFAQRDIADTSAIYWHKDHEIDLSIEADGRVVAESRPSSAVLYRAVEQTIDGIEAELRLCRDLAVTLPFEAAPRRPGRELPHHWKLEPIVYRDVRPRDDRFVYVDGAFRPDTSRLLELLGGRELYRDGMMAARELVQNAFDAVRERIGWQRLRERDPVDEELASRLRAAHRVELSLDRRSDGAWWLTCRDTGAGMTREILTNYLLVSGTGRHPESIELERLAHEAGFEVERAGQFGIGVLSYFMLADRLQLRTHRCLEAPSGEAHGWAFSSDGVGSFGELTVDEDWTLGTEVSLRLTEAIDAHALGLALKRLIVHAPCETTLMAGGDEIVALRPGWTATLDDLVEYVRERIWRNFSDREEEDDYLPEDERNRRRGRLAALRDAIDHLGESIRWVTAEQEMSGGLGRCRIALPYLETPAGISLALLNTEQLQGRWYLNGIGLGRLVRFDFDLGHSVGGMHIGEHVDDDFPHFRHYQWITQVDWRPPAAGRVLASRDEIMLSDEASSAIKELETIARQHVSDLLEAQPPGPLRRLNARIAEGMGVESPPGLESRWWLHWQPAEGGGWWPALEELELPIVASRYMSRALRVGSTQVDRPGYIDTGFADSFGEWESPRQPPERFVLDLDRTSLVGYWSSLTLSSPDTFDLFPSFPPGSEHVVGIALGNGSPGTTRFAWNSASPICSGAWARQRPRERPEAPVDPLADRASLQSPARARRWLFDRFAAYRRHALDWYDVKDLWSGLVARDRGFVSELIALAMGAATDSEALLLIDYEYGGTSPRTVAFGPNGVEVTEEKELGDEIVRLWSADGWCVEEDDD